MTESKIGEEIADEKGVHSFGERLYVERKRQNLTIADVSKSIHLSEKIIDAIERSDISRLPQPTFVQGYLRSYARHLGVSDKPILEEYAHAVPHKLETELQPRSTLPDEASSDSPIVKMITLTMLVLMIAAALYAAFSYYKNAIVVGQDEPEMQTMLSLPESDLSAETDVLDDGVDVYTEQAQAEQVQPAIVVGEVAVSTSTGEQEPVQMQSTITEEKEQAPTLTSTTEEMVTEEKVNNQLVADGDDVLELSASQVSWIEVEDSKGVNLYYDLLPQGQSVRLQGAAPFKIFLGNAPEVQLSINGMAVNMKNRIRTNNVAQFKISVDHQQIVFH
ncbi:MAG: DUF4115 domain-containing protein [Gammaproteobacteria bacterium]|nr:DUF4115 domain-containing protein [Gammaproteobacteria bacterium]